MSERSKLTQEEAINVGRETKNMRGPFFKVIFISLIPLLLMGIATSIIANVSIRNSLEEEIRKEIRMGAYGLGKSYSLIDEGDFEKREDGLIYKGSKKASGRLVTVGEEYLENGVVGTFFFGDTRIDTTVTDINGNNMAGTRLDEEIYKEIVERGEELFCESVDLGGRKYYGYYIPYRNSTGEIAAIFFSGRLRKDVMDRVWGVNERLLWTGLVVLVIGIIISMLCSMYMVGLLYRHFKNEQNMNIQKIVANSQLDFMTLVTREVRDPIDSITVLSDRILDEETSPEIRTDVLGIKEASNSMLISFNSIKDYSRLESGDIKIETDEYELTNLVEGSIKKINPGLERKQLDFNVNYDKTMPNFLKGDYDKIRQILDNLLENAVKYTYDGGIKLDIGYRKITSGKIDVSFTIIDTGAGIREEDAKRLFSSIGKVGDNKDLSIKGTGLGLLICKQLVNLLDGMISVESEIGKGSTFRFTVPQDVLNSRTVGDYLKDDI